MTIRKEEWTEMHEQIKEVCKKIGVTKSWSESFWIRKNWRGERHLETNSCRPKKSKYTRLTGDLRCVKASSQSGGMISTRPCECARVDVGASDVHHVSWDRVDDPWPS